MEQQSNTILKERMQNLTSKRKGVPEGDEETNSCKKNKARKGRTVVVDEENDEGPHAVCTEAPTQYDEGPCYYQIEDPKELNFVLDGVSCGLCGTVFGRSANECKPSAKTPVYACVGMRKVDICCKHAICFKCFENELKANMRIGNDHTKRVRRPKTLGD